jgi:hypothetical protein
LALGVARGESQPLMVWRRADQQQHAQGLEFGGAAGE